VKGDFAAWDEAGEFGGHCDVEAGGWMACDVDGAEAVDADMGVALGCLEAGVAEQFGDVADVGSAVEQEGGDGVAEEVAASLLVDAGLLEVALDLAGEPVGADWCAHGGEEQSRSGVSVAEAGSGEVEVEAHPEEGAFADGDVPVFGAFASADEDGGSFKVDVSDCQVDQFLAAQGAGVEDLEDGAVAQPEGPCYVGLRQQRRHLGRAERRLGQPPLRSRHQKVACWVGSQVAATTEPRKEVADRDESLSLRGDGKWPAISLAVVEQPLLVALQELIGDCAGLFDSVLVTEAAEVAEIAAAAADRRVGVVVDPHPKQVLLDLGFDRCHERGSSPETSERIKLGNEHSLVSGSPGLRGGSVRRYYDPATGQFLNVDPAVDETEAPYAYVDGDPVDNTDPLGLGCSWTDPNPWDCAKSGASAIGGKAASVVVTTVGYGIAVEKTVVRSAPAPFISVAAKTIAYGARLGIGATAAGVGQLVSDAGTTLSIGSRFGRAAVAAGIGVIGTVVGVAVGGICETGSIVFTAGATTPLCVVSGIGAASLTNFLLNRYVGANIDSLFGWDRRRSIYACGA
jgi:hypothetical protein